MSTDIHISEAEIGSEIESILSTLPKSGPSFPYLRRVRPSDRATELEKINQGQGSVGKLVNEETFYRNAKLTLQKVEKATEGLEDQGPLSVLGIAVNSLLTLQPQAFTTRSFTLRTHVFYAPLAQAPASP